MDDLSTLGIVYTASPHVTQRPTVDGGSLLTQLYTKRQEVTDGIVELDQLITMCQELLDAEGA